MANDSIIIKKKKVVGHGGHHGGSWKVAYADFVTAMMAFFMVMWIMGLSDDNKAMISGYFNDPAGFMKNPPKTKDVVSMPGASKLGMQLPKSRGTGMGDEPGLGMSNEGETKAVQEDFQRKLLGLPVNQRIADNIEITTTSEGILIEFLEDYKSLFFQSGSAQISPTGKEIIKTLAPIVYETGRFMRVEGHTDRKPYAGDQYTNWELSNDRASALRRELAKNGIPNNRFKGVFGFADTRLKYKDKPFAPGNRRVSLLLPWGKKAAKGNTVKYERAKIKERIPHQVNPGKFNLFADKPKEPHL
ncbi:MAG TPA: flagellar motor protein MotB [Fimbriimonas sp.]|nr:flagellar motor protein MotB [Fimbriimonas sp.]